MTQDHSNCHNLETPNKFSLSSLICPPQLYSYPGNPRQNWVTFNPLIDKTNSYIDVFNTDVRTAHGEILGGEGSYKVVAGLQHMGCRKKRAVCPRLQSMEGEGAAAKTPFEALRPGKSSREMYHSLQTQHSKWSITVLWKHYC